MSRLHQELIIYTSWTHDFDLDYKGRKLSERLKAERDKNYFNFTLSDAFPNNHEGFGHDYKPVLWMHKAK